MKLKNINKIIIVSGATFVMGLYSTGIMAFILAWMGWEYYIALSIILIIILFFIGKHSGKNQSNAIGIFIPGSVIGTSGIICYGLFGFFKKGSDSLWPILIITSIAILLSFIIGILIQHKKWLITNASRGTRD